MKKLLFILLIPIFTFGQAVKVETTEEIKQRLKEKNKSVYRIDSLSIHGIILSNGWKFTFGDNPEYAKFDFTDTLKWSSYAIDTPFKYFKISNQKQIGWFRKKIYIDSALVNKPFLVGVKITGAAEIYLNGQLLHKIGTITSDIQKSKLFYHKEPTPYSITFNKPAEQTLAIRYVMPEKFSDINDSDYFPISMRLREIESFYAFLDKSENNKVLDGVIIGLFLMMSIIHFFFNSFFKSQRYNVLFGMAALLFAMFFLIPKFYEDQAELDSYLFSVSFKNALYHIAHVLMLLAIFDYLQQPIKKIFWGILSCILVIMVLSFFELINSDFFGVAYILIVINYIILIWSAIRNKKLSGKHLRNALIMFISSIVLCFIIMIFISIFLVSYDYKLIEDMKMFWVSPFIILFMAGPQLSISGAISFGLAKEFVKTNLSLEHQLKENEKLSSEKQEILYQQNELLEQQVAERTAELEKSFVELKETQNQLIQREKLASLGELTAGIAHEIQNPLNFVNNFSEVSKELIEEIQDERKKEKGERDEELEDEILGDLVQNLEKINHHGKRASNIVKGMLEHSRMSSGEKQLIDVNALADEYLRLSYHGLRAKDKSFNSDFKAELDNNLPKINVIPQDLGRVFLNLINNAFYAVQKKEQSKIEGYKPNVIVKSMMEDNWLRFEITDNGTGMPESVKAKIFQPFFTTKPTGEGTGLGLSLSYDIITKGHGGTIECKSVEDIGTTFIIKLPIT